VLRHVTLPALLPVTVFTAVWQTITALQLFDLIFTTTRGAQRKFVATMSFTGLKG
jgi:multiple sugar transport system permease protein